MICFLLLPSAFIVHISPLALLDADERLYAIIVPSGDHGETTRESRSELALTDPSTLMT